MCIHPQPFNESDADAMPSLAVTAIPTVGRTPKSNAVPLRLCVGLAMARAEKTVRFSLLQCGEWWPAGSHSGKLKRAGPWTAILLSGVFRGIFRGVPL